MYISVCVDFAHGICRDILANRDASLDPSTLSLSNTHENTMSIQAGITIDQFSPLFADFFSHIHEKLEKITTPCKTLASIDAEYICQLADDRRKGVFFCFLFVPQKSPSYLRRSTCLQELCEKVQKKNKKSNPLFPFSSSSLANIFPHIQPTALSGFGSNRFVQPRVNFLNKPYTHFGHFVYDYPPNSCTFTFTYWFVLRFFRLLSALNFSSNLEFVSFTSSGWIHHLFHFCILSFSASRIQKSNSLTIEQKHIK